MKKSLSQFKTRDELVQAIEDKRAVPELSLKRNIFDQHQRVIESKALMMRNKNLNGFYNNRDVQDFAVELSALYDYFSLMIKAKMEERRRKKTLSSGDVEAYGKLRLLEEGRVKVSSAYVPSLILIKRFLEDYLYYTNFTNLYQSEDNPFRKIEEEY